jgi:hypothetical protein
MLNLKACYAVVTEGFLPLRKFVLAEIVPFMGFGAAFRVPQGTAITTAGFVPSKPPSPSAWWEISFDIKGGGPSSLADHVISRGKQFHLLDFSTELQKLQLASRFPREQKPYQLRCLTSEMTSGYSRP